MKIGWKTFVPALVLGLMLASACATQDTGGTGGGGLNPYGSGSAPRQGGSAGSMSGGGSASSAMP